MQRLRSTYAPIVAAILATACGGDGGVAPVPAPVGPTMLQISTANQDAVARAAIASTQPFTSISSIGITPSPAPATAVLANAASVRERGSLMHLTKKAVDFGVARSSLAAPGMARALAVQTSAMPCGESGTLAITWDDTDNSATVSTGDTLTMSFVQCSDLPNTSIDGAMVFSPSVVEADSFAGSLTLRQLVLTDQGTSVLMNGALSFSLSQTPTSNGIKDLGSYVVTGAGLTVATSGSGYSDTFTYRSGYTVTQEDFVPNLAGINATSAIRANGSFRSSALGGDLSLTTTRPFQLTHPDDNPRDGQLMVGGLKDTKLGLTAVSNLQVRMEVCDDGDGVWEATKVVDWSWLIQ